MALHRIFVLLVALSLLFAVLTLRLFWLQAVETAAESDDPNNAIRRAVKQRGPSVVLDDGRGRIVDAGGVPLAGVPAEALLVLPEEAHAGEGDAEGAASMEETVDEEGSGAGAAGEGVAREDVPGEGASGKDAVGAGAAGAESAESSGSAALSRQLAEILGIPRDQAEDLLGGKEPVLWRKAGEREPAALTDKQAEALRRIGSGRLLVVPYVRRYPDRYLAAHLIGYLSEHPEQMERLYAEELKRGKLKRSDLIGASGLERSLDRFLHGTEETVFTDFRDGARRRLDGIGYRIRYPDNPYTPLTAVTTLDAALQAEVEALMDNLALKDAAIVVLDAATADVKAMAVRPLFDPYAVEPERGLWRNLAVTAEIPGSVFKIVTAAAALEHGVVRPGETFRCDGEAVYGVRCWKPGGHGTISLEQAFAQSCNTAFARIAARLTAEQLEQTARALGLLQPIGWSGGAVKSPFGGDAPLRQFDGEEAGRLFVPGAARGDKGALAQTAIGQRDVRITPLQAANLAAIVASGGRVHQPRAVSEIRYANHRTAFRFERQRLRAAGLSPAAARWLQAAMGRAVTEGTAKRLAGGEAGVAGKTGTAEAGRTGGRLEHHWFVGFTPARAPKAEYAFAIVVRNVDAKRGEHRAITVAEGLLPLLSKMRSG